MTAQTVMLGERADFKPNDIAKFTIVMWIEGNDADCKDGMIGGQLKCEMQFNVVEGSFRVGRIILFILP